MKYNMMPGQEWWALKVINKILKLIPDPTSSQFKQREVDVLFSSPVQHIAAVFQ